ncbi:MAG: MT-A70 family methyltransferase [Rhizobiaceae bacterium]
MNALPVGPFNVIYADPPWRFRSWSERGEGKSACQHYDVMDLDALCQMPVDRIAAADAVLFIWVVQPMLPQALRLIDAWGFTYKTVAFCWVKLKGRSEQDRLFYAAEDVRLGMGYHTRAGMEQCWLATRGHGYDRFSRREAQVCFEGMREHSRKPDQIAESIASLTGNVPRLELFARTRRPGWHAWGNEIGKFTEAAE